MIYAYDIETFPNCFILCAENVVDGMKYRFEISHRINQRSELHDFINALMNHHAKMVGFNNVGFDYPVLHFVLRSNISDPRMIYEKAMSIINAADSEKFLHLVKPSEYWVPQIDLFKIHHFDNKARMTSLKALEFNMRLPNIEDLPFPVGKTLDSAEMKKLGDYCENDVAATVAFYFESKEKIEFREQLSHKHNLDFTNFSDVKIGKQIFQIAMEKAGVDCYNYSPDTGRTPRQTPRESIHLADCIPSYVRLGTPEFRRILDQLSTTTITQTKGAFKDLGAKVGDLTYWFGTGGIHASVDKECFVADDDMMIYDVDVTSLYPSLAIENGLFPEHLGPTFVEVYRDLKEQRLRHKKGTPENAALKLALNGVYGDSNSPFSFLYDPKFTMSITIAGQLSMAMLIERFLELSVVRVIQANTDGVTLYLPRDAKFFINTMCREWEYITGLSLESVEYSRMWVADVNSYVAETVDGKVKRKGRYEYETEWHQNASALVVPKVAEKILLNGGSIEHEVKNWPDLFDFMLRVKVPRSSKLVVETEAGDKQLENTQRYYIAKRGYSLTKIMPPLAKAPDKVRRIAINSGHLVCPCNNILEANSEIDFRWYINEVEKLVMEIL